MDTLRITDPPASIFKTPLSALKYIWHPRNPVVLIILPRSLRAQAQLSETVTEIFELVKVEPKNFKTLENERKRKGERRGGSRAGVPVENSWKPIC
ncbi:hypothetical protein TNCV_4495791 [Trichonephila clavipes]|nr:hypothetical protein TNCV_4495791 [Trichonephila clavipes]